MSVFGRPGQQGEATADGLPTGLAGTLGLRIMDGQGATTTARSTTGIIESPAGSGVYTATRTWPTTDGTYQLVWDTGGSTPVFRSEDLIVNPTGQPPGAGATYSTVDELRARFPEITTGAYADDVVDAALATAEQIIEAQEACDVAFTPRTATLLVPLDASGLLALPSNRVTALTAASGSVSGTLDVTGVRIIAGRYAKHPTAWPTDEDITATYTHGWTDTPLRIVQAAQLYARTLLIRGPVDDRATQIPAVDGGVINLLTPGLRGSVTGIPEVDAAIIQYAESTPLA